MTGQTPPRLPEGDSGWGRLDDEENSEGAGQAPSQVPFYTMGFNSIAHAMTIGISCVLGLFLLAWGIVWVRTSSIGWAPLIVGAIAIAVVVVLVVRQVRRRRDRTS